jgi:uncharacterized protein
MQSRYLNPYAAGVLLGLVLLATIFVTGHGLGASGAIKNVVAASVGAAAPSHAARSGYYSAIVGPDLDNPLASWLVFEVTGVLIGAFLSGLISGRLKVVTESGPRMRRGPRWAFAALGGALFWFGAQFARGCTSGAALSGMAVLSTAGFVTMLAIFGTGYAGAYLARRLWL